MNKMKKIMAIVISYLMIVTILPISSIVALANDTEDIKQYFEYNYATDFGKVTLYKDKATYVRNKYDRNSNYDQNYNNTYVRAPHIYSLIDGEEKEVFDIETYAWTINNLGEKVHYQLSYGGLLEYNFTTEKIYVVFDDKVDFEGIRERVIEKHNLQGYTLRQIMNHTVYDTLGNKINIARVVMVENPLDEVYKEYYVVNDGKNEYISEDLYNVFNGNTTSEYIYNDGNVYISAHNNRNNIQTIIRLKDGKVVETSKIENVDEFDEIIFSKDKLYIRNRNNVLVEYIIKNNQYVFNKSYGTIDGDITVDANNNVWLLQSESNHKYVCKIEDGKLVKKYEVFRMMDTLNVYDDDNLLVASRWGYTHITKKSTSDNNNNGGNDNTTEDKNEVVVKPEVNETIDGTTKVEVGTLTPGATNVIEATVGNNVDKVEVTLTDVETIKNGEGAVTVKLNDGNKINLPFSILSDEMLDGAKEVKVEFTAKEDKKITGGLKAVNKVFSFELLVTKEEGQVSIHNFADGEVEVTLALTDEDLKGLDRSKLVVLYYNEETKEYEEMKTVVDGNNVTFKTPHFSKFIVAEKEIISDGESNKEEGTTGNGSGSNGLGSNNNGSTGTATGTTNAGSTTTTTNKKPATTSNKLVATGTVASTSVLTMLGLILSGVGATLFVRRK